MKTITVNTGKRYGIYIERGLIDRCGELIKPLCAAEKVGIISDSNIAPIYLERVSESLKDEGYSVYSHIFPAGESSKNLDTIAGMYAFLADNCFSRRDIVIALGGGVTGDMAGFAAATYMRGIDFVQIPTSLLAQVDSSVGGKTGVDLPQGKNLVGSFFQPIAVIIDPDTLDTLPDRFKNDGMAEVIKYGCIKSRRLFDFIDCENAFEHIEEVIAACVMIKRDVVSRDERESGERMLLNFGHTFGHAIEKLSGYTGITHGEAVSVGMVMAARICAQLNLCCESLSDEIALLCLKYHLPVGTKFEYADIVNACLNDKKATASGVNFVCLSEIGTSFTRKLSAEELLALEGNSTA